MTPEAKRVAEALRQLDPQQLEQAAAHVQGPLGELLAQMAKVDADQVDPKAMEQMFQKSFGDRKQVESLLKQVMDSFAGQAGALGGALESIGDALRGPTGIDAALSTYQDALSQTGALEEDEELSAGLERLIGEARARVPSGELQEALSEMAHLSGTVQTLLKDALQDPERTAARARALHDRLEALEATVTQAAAQTQDTAKLETILVDLSGLARERDHLVAPELEALGAFLAEQRLGLEDSDVLSRWVAVFETATEMGHMAVARSAGQRVQLVATANDDMEAVAGVAHRVAGMARERGETRAEVFALLEEATARSRLEGQGPLAIKLAEDAVALAEAKAPWRLRARALLTLGQIREQLGEHKDARQAFLAVMRQAEKDTSFPAETSQAAIRLGLIERSLGRWESSDKLLNSAQVVAHTIEDWITYARAVMERVSAALENGHAEDAKALLVAACAEVTAGVGEHVAEALRETIVDEVNGRHGADAANGL